jgi:hypothetical protein
MSYFGENVATKRGKWNWHVPSLIQFRQAATDLLNSPLAPTRSKLVAGAAVAPACCDDMVKKDEARRDKRIGILCEDKNRTDTW